ncbi:MAG: GAF domain-containing protein [Ferruginibacter sp.]
MQSPTTPPDEELRLKELYSFNILDSAEDEDYNGLVELAAHICGCPIAGITFIDKDRQWFKTEKNIGMKQGSRELSFCGHAILQKEVMIVNDTSKDARFFDNPYVVQSSKIGFYAGAPIISSAGYPLGAICAMDNIPRHLTEAQIRSLETIARQVSKLLELKKKNEYILTTSEELIMAEKKIEQLNINKREEENFSTAYQLHEKIAQTLVAIKLYISFARSSKDLADHFLEKSINEIVTLTDTITALSRSITPTTYDDDNYTAHIEDMLAKFGEEQQIPVIFKDDKYTSYLNGNPGLIVFRIIQDALKYAKSDNASTISLQIKSQEDFSILFRYDGKINRVYSFTELKMLETNIINRLEMLKGKITIDTHKEKDNLIEISIPFTLLKKQ